MTRKRPPQRVVIERSSDNPKRDIRSTIPSIEDRSALCERATYDPSPKHKYHPHAYGLQPYAGGSVDRVFCDEHANFLPADMERISQLLERGITAGLWGDNDAQGDPAMLWTIDDNGWIYEARITIPGRAKYHAYPLLPGDAFARKVISHFGSWASSLSAQELHRYPTVLAAERAAQVRYK